MKKMKKKGLLLAVVVAILATMVTADLCQAWEWGKYPTLDAWRLAGIRNGDSDGYRDGYNGYPHASLWGKSPEYCEGYREGYARGRHESYYYRSYGQYGQGYGPSWGHPRRR